MSKLGVLISRHIFESGDEKRLKTQIQDLSDLSIQRDLAYLNDGERGHLFDIYELKDAPVNAPLMINIHGGGLFASYKEVNVNFNYEWARMGYRVVSISYRRIPETTLWHQIDDVMAALRYIEANAQNLHLNLNDCYLTGDSAGALLSLYALSLMSSEKLQIIFNIRAPHFSIHAAGMISIMLDTQRTDLMRALSSGVANRTERHSPYGKYLLDPSLLLEEAKLPPLFLVTSEEDLIQKDTLKFENLLREQGREYEILQFPAGTDHELVHVFSVMYPMYPESKEVFEKMNAYFRQFIEE